MMKGQSMQQVDIDKNNAEFWNELCGTSLAQKVGICDHSPESLQRFDEAFFAFYPYFLPEIIRPQRLADKDVLEIGLGYGSLSQQIANAKARYTGLDIAPNAIRMVNHRLEMQALPGHAVQGSALEMPFPDESFDFVISIGCFHHTGNTQRCLDETHRVLRPGGTAIIMVYNKFAYTQWIYWPLFTFKELLHDWGYFRTPQKLSDSQRRIFDSNSLDQAAPETVLWSKKELRTMLHCFEQVTLQTRNASHIESIWMQRFKRVFTILLSPLGWKINYRNGIIVNRFWFLSTLGKTMGLDIYLEAKKGQAQISSGFMSHAA
jgi:ubiquinone/menaquinone biosynthesis C-methylase UbiE